MVHRLHNRNTGYSDNFTNSTAINHTTLQATEGATALDLNKVVAERSEQEEIKEESSNTETLKNVSMENAAYLQSMEESKDEIETDFKQDSDIPNFEVDSIELATPQLFAENQEENITENHTGNEINSELIDVPIIENIWFSESIQEFRGGFERRRFLGKCWGPMGSENLKLAQVIPHNIASYLYTT